MAKGRRSNNGGSITKKVDKKGNILYYARISLPSGGRTGKYFPKEKEAQAWITEQLGDIQKGVFAQPTKQTFGEWISNWLNNYMKLSLRVTTWESYDIMIKKHIEPNLGQIKLSDLQTAHLQKLYNDKLSGGRADKKEGGLAPKTVRYIHTIIHAALEQAIKERKLSVNPADAVRLPKVIKKEMKVLSGEDVSKFLQAASEYRLYAAFYLELSTGLRRGELLGLRWKDIDFKNDTIEVVQQVVKTPKGKYIIQEPKTRLSRRKISVGEDVIIKLKDHKKKQEEQLKALGYDDIKIKGHYKEGIVFINELGTIIQPRNFVRTYKAILKRAGLDLELRFHDLRHTFATMSLQQGIDIKTLQSDLGHHAAAFTLDVYSHVTTGMKKTAAQKRSEFLKACIEK